MKFGAGGAVFHAMACDGETDTVYLGRIRLQALCLSLFIGNVIRVARELMQGGDAGDEIW